MNIKKHRTLERKLWNIDNTLRSDVREMLLSIAWAYIDNVRCKMGLQIYNSDIKDIFLYGSSTNYFYNKKSDIDVCILFDIEAIKQRTSDQRVEKHLAMFYYNWAMTHHCSIYGRKVDLSIDNVIARKYNGHHRSGATYSLINNRWIYKPVMVSDAEFKKIKKEARKIYKEIMRDYRETKRKGFQMEDIQTLYRNIYQSKNLAHSTNILQPVTSMYIAFRKIRNRGILEKLQQRAIKIESSEFVLK